MLYNYLGTMAFILVLWLSGQMAIKCAGLSKLPYKNIHFLSIPMGIPICALLADLLYLRIGTSVGMVRIAYGLLASAAVVVLVKKGVTRQEMIGLAGMLVLFHIMLLPAILNGGKYYVHRGNIWDHYFYLSEVVYMSIYKVSDMAKQLLSETNISDVYIFGYGAINSDRPTAPLLCAVLAGKGWGDIFFQAHLFLIAVWTSVFGSLMLAVEMITKKFRFETGAIRKKIMMVFLCLLYTGGFFGQIQYDINAWSQLVSMGSLTAFVCVYFLILEELMKGKEALTFQQYGLLLVLGSGLFLIYPENTMLQGGILVLVSALVFVVRRRKVNIKTIGIFASLPILIVAVASIVHFGTVKFALIQMDSAGSAVRQGWASYFDAYWQGAYPLPTEASIKGLIKRIICFLPSLFGMYIITPNFSIPNLAVKWGWIGMVAVLGLGILVFLIRYLFKMKAMLQSDEDCHRGLVGSLCYIGLAVYAVMMLFGKYWSAGKLFLYISPYVYLLFLYPILDVRDREVGEYIRKIENLLGGGKPDHRRGNKRTVKGRQIIDRTIKLTVSVIFVCCQLLLVSMRVYDALENKDCTGYLGNYPSDQYPYLKQNYPYEFDAKAYKGNEVVAIHIEDGWYQDYVKIALAYEGIPYYAVPDTMFNRYILKEVQPKLKEGDVLIRVEDTYKNKGR